MRKLFLLFLVAHQCFCDQEKRPNILWIVGENLKLDLGCYGAQNVKTPHLDKLASEGERYTKVFSTSPVCAPSRSAFFVGMYQTTTDTHNMRSHREDNYRLLRSASDHSSPERCRVLYQQNHERGGDRFWETGLNFVNEGKLYDGSKWEDLKKNQPFFR